MISLFRLTSTIKYSNQNVMRSFVHAYCLIPHSYYYGRQLRNELTKRINEEVYIYMVWLTFLAFYKFQPGISMSCLHAVMHVFAFCCRSKNTANLPQNFLKMQKTIRKWWSYSVADEKDQKAKTPLQLFHSKNLSIYRLSHTVIASGLCIPSLATRSHMCTHATCYTHYSDTLHIYAVWI